MGAAGSPRERTFNLDDLYKSGLKSAPTPAAQAATVALSKALPPTEMVEGAAAAEIAVDREKKRPLWSPGIRAQKDDPIPYTNPYYPENHWDKAAFCQDYAEDGVIVSAAVI